MRGTSFDDESVTTNLSSDSNQLVFDCCRKIFNYNNIFMNYAKALRIARAAKNIDQQTIASKASLSKSLISKIESHQRDLSPKAKEKLIKALDISPKLFDFLALESKETFLTQKQLKEIFSHLLNIKVEIESLDE